MTLREQRCLFTQLVARLIQRAKVLGYEVAGDQWVRTKAEAERNAAAGTGIANSLHIDGLAIDLLLYKDGVYQRGTEAHRDLGEWWERQHPLARWGGRFTRPDGGHYSLTRGGRS